MRDRLNELIKRYWPALRLRTILIGVLLFTAAMPGIGAVFLRVYENTLVRQTEAELVSQSAALAASAQILWPGYEPPVGRPDRDEEGYYVIEDHRVDLQGDPILPERPAPEVLEPERIYADALSVSDTFGPMIDETSRVTLASIIFLDATGRVVRGELAGADFSELPEVAVALDGGTESVLRHNGSYQPQYDFEWLSRASSLRIHFARPIEVNGEIAGVLLLSRSPRALFRGIYEDRGKIALGVAVIFGVLVLLALAVSRGVTRPIEGLSAATKRVAAGHGEIPETPPTAAVEIRQLYEDFRMMAETISMRSRYLKDFAAALSHEFKTPLAGIAGAVEIFEDHHETMSDEERRRFLANISADTERLSQLVRRLLDLARADMSTPEAGAAANLGNVLRGLADALSVGDFKVEVTLPDDILRVAMPEATLETVVNTLIENARQAGATEVKVEAGKDKKTARLTVTDNGPGIPDADLGRIFEPFFTSRREDGGSGLGLPIARSLITASRGEITALPSSGGARFELTLPLA